MQSATGQYGTQAGEPAQPVQHSVIIANSLGRFLRGVAIPSDFGSILRTAVAMGGIMTQKTGRWRCALSKQVSRLGSSCAPERVAGSTPRRPGGRLPTALQAIRSPLPASSDWPRRSYFRCCNRRRRAREWSPAAQCVGPWSGSSAIDLRCPGRSSCCLAAAVKWLVHWWRAWCFDPGCPRYSVWSSHCYSAAAEELSSAGRLPPASCLVRSYFDPGFGSLPGSWSHLDRCSAWYGLAYLAQEAV